MGKLFGSIALALCIWLSLAGVCLAKQVYLQDGGIIECKSFLRRGNDVVVIINRDTVVEFAANEINMKKTFAGAGKKRPAGKKPVAGAAPAAAITAPKGAKTAPSPAPAAKTVPPTQAAQTKTQSAALAAAAKPAPAAPQTQAARTPAAPAEVVTPPPAPVAVARKTAPTEEATGAPAEPAAPLDKAELERKRKEAAAMMTEALQKNDPELMKKAVLLQKSTIQPEDSARSEVIGMKLIMIILVCSLLIIVSLWVVFEKGGSSGWICLIPIYNMYVLMQIAGKPGWWAFLTLIPVVGAIAYLLAMLELAEKFGRGALFGVGLVLLPMFFFPLLAFGGSRYEEQFSFS